MNRNDVIDVLTAVTACDRRTVGETDVTVWANVIGDLPKDLCLRAVVDHFRNHPGVWLEPGHIYQRVRAVIRDQLERESDIERERRQAERDARIPDYVAQIAEVKASQLKNATRPPIFIREPGPNALSVACPFCHASVGNPCHVAGSRDLLTKTRAHPSRIEAVENGELS